MGEKIVGTCGNCGGPVTLPTVWWSVIPPVPRCRQCGATPKSSYGKTIPMNPFPKPPSWDESGSWF